LDPRAERIRTMFDRIAAVYDLCNALFSLRRDAAWRRRAAVLAQVAPGISALDLCTGTGQLAEELRRRGAGEVIGLDFSPAMLARARRRYPQARFEEGDALALPYPAARFDVVTMAFGMRNLTEPAQALREARRVLRSPGRCVILEFARPDHPAVAGLYACYLHRVMPALAGLFARRRHAYRYLAETIQAFPEPTAFAAAMRAAGFAHVSLHRMTGGIVAFYVGQA